MLLIYRRRLMTSNSSNIWYPSLSINIEGRTGSIMSLSVTLCLLFFLLLNWILSFLNIWLSSILLSKLKFMDVPRVLIIQKIENNYVLRSKKVFFFIFLIIKIFIASQGCCAHLNIKPKFNSLFFNDKSYDICKECSL